MTRTAIAGVGYTAFSKRSGRTVLDLAAEACRNAAGDAGLPLSAIDGILSYSTFNDSVPSEAAATALGLPSLRYVMDFAQGGQAPCFMVQHAAMAIEAGYANAVLIFRALNGRSGTRIGSGSFAGSAAQHRNVIGYNVYLMYMAMWARRYMIETGATEEDLAAVAVAQRWYAERNERAIVRKPLDRTSYFQSPVICDPLRAADCTSEVDGACALLVTSLERARDLKHSPAVVASAAYRACARAGFDMGDMFLYEDYTRNYTSLLRDDLFGRAGLSPRDVDLAEIYDCFSIVVLLGLEGLGFCGRGEAGAFTRSGATAINGKLPVNTHGGLLDEGYIHGMNTVTEAVLQIQGRGGERQAPHHDVAVVTSGAGVDGSALVLTRDH